MVVENSNKFSLMWLVFLRQKWIILSVVILGIIIANYYIWMQKPVYEAKASIIPATLNDYANFNYKRSILLQPLKMEAVTAQISQELFSLNNRQSFFQEVYLPSLSEDYRQTKSYDELYKEFNNRVIIREDPKFVPVHYSLIVKAFSQKQAVFYANAYLNMVQEKAEKNLNALLNHETKEKIDILEQEITFIRNVAKLNRSSKLENLNQAFKIATQLNIVKTQSSKGPLYLLGTDALKAEISAINDNDSVDAFAQAYESSSLPVLLTQIEILKNTIKSIPDIKVFHIDGEISASVNPISPNKWLINILAMVISSLLGGLLALHRSNRIYPINNAERLWTNNNANEVRI